MINDLPSELLHAVIAQLAACDLIRLAASCRKYEVLTDSAAEQQCADGGIVCKGLWCGRRSWRVQLHGRTFRRGGSRVHRQLGSAGTRNVRLQERTFAKPVAIAALPGGRAVVCNSGGRCLTVVRLSDGSVEQRLPVDGMPSGICCIPGLEAVIVSVQGQDESGASVSGVVNQAHRIEMHALAGTAAEGGVADTLLWSEAGHAGLSYPNGLALSYPGDRHQLLTIADWNNHRVATLRVPNFTLGAAPSAAQAGWAFDHLEWATVSRADWRPSDVALLPGLGRDGNEVLAIADYYSSAVRLYVYLESDAYTGYTGCGSVGCKSRKPRQQQPQQPPPPPLAVKGNLERPSALAVASSGVDAAGRCWAVLLVAETGAMCISAFKLTSSTGAWQAGADGFSCGVTVVSEHLCDLGSEQLGSGLHAPLRSQWGWLGIDVAPNGDVIVSDCDNDCLYIV